jgi:hypothetical protein
MTGATLAMTVSHIQASADHADFTGRKGIFPLMTTITRQTMSLSSTLAMTERSLTSGNYQADKGYFTLTHHY